VSITNHSNAGKNVAKNPQSWLIWLYTWLKTAPV